MSTRTAATNLGREHTGDRAIDSVQAAASRVGYRLERFPLVDSVLVVGESDRTQPGGFTDGVTFTAGQTKEVYHGLGRVPAMCVAVDVQDADAQIRRNATGLTKGLEKTHIRLTHSGASTTRVKLLVA